MGAKVSAGAPSSAFCQNSIFLSLAIAVCGNYAF